MTGLTARDIKSLYQRAYYDARVYVQRKFATKPVHCNNPVRLHIEYRQHLPSEEGPTHTSSIAERPSPHLAGEGTHPVWKNERKRARESGRPFVHVVLHTTFWWNGRPLAIPFEADVEISPEETHT